jgi:predicted PhzF superfamily epimerase YddE/YHI9
MLHIAQELSVSETAFITPLDTSARFSIGYFSPKMEIALCGQATLASGRAVFSRIWTRRGSLHKHQNLDFAVRTAKDRISMVLPVYETQPAEAPPALLAALGIKAIRSASYNTTKEPGSCSWRLPRLKILPP